MKKMLFGDVFEEKSITACDNKNRMLSNLSKDVLAHGAKRVEATFKPT
jgi:hypothetical protein